MKSISAITIYYTSGPYGPLQHAGPRRHFSTEEELRGAVKNAESILRRRGANHIVLDTDKELAVQVSGYNGTRGAFVDVLPVEELSPYLDLDPDPDSTPGAKTVHAQKITAEVLSAVENDPRDPYGPPLVRYIVRVDDPSYNRLLFIRAFSRHGYRWTTDPTYARHFSLATAQKHAQHLSNLAERPDS